MKVDETAMDYRPCHDNHPASRDDSDDKFVGQILLYNTFGGPGLSPGFTVDPLVWGGIRTHIMPLVRQTKWREWRWLPYWVAFMFVGGKKHPDLEERVGKWFPALIIGYIALGCLIDWYVVRRFTQRVASATEYQVNATLQPLGYYATYTTERTGECHTREHRMNLYAAESTVKRLATADLLARLPRPVLHGAREPVSVCIYGTPFQHVFTWFCNWNRPRFVSDDTCPIEGIPICLWGAFRDSLYVPRLENLQTKYIGFLVFWVFLTLLGIWEGTNWWFAPVFLSPLLLGIVLVSHWYLSSISRNVGHPQWHQAVHQWQTALRKFGWRVEYHHGPLEATCCTSPDFWLLFAPAPCPDAAEEDSVQV